MIELKILKNKFVDLDSRLLMHPISKDVAKKVNENAVIASIKNLILTRRYERPFHPEISSDISDLLFEQLTISTASMLERQISYVIENFEPRVQLLMVQVTEESDHEIAVLVSFKIIGSLDTIKTQFILQRTL